MMSLAWTAQRGSCDHLLPFSMAVVSGRSPADLPHNAVEPALMLSEMPR
jgi:hypothetical protein